MKLNRIIMVIGLPGTGKTTFSQELAKSIGAVHLNSDIIRSQINLRGKYDLSSKEIVYTELLRRLELTITKGEDVIIDATLYKERLRAPYNNLATKHKISIKWIELKTSEEVIRERVNKKRQFSEADFSVYLKIKEEYEPLTIPHLVLQTDMTEQKEQIPQALTYLQIEEE